MSQGFQISSSLSVVPHHIHYFNRSFQPLIHWDLRALVSNVFKTLCSKPFSFIIFPPNNAKPNIMICAESNHQRISFASDLGQSDKAPSLEQQQQPSGGLVRRDTTLLDSSSPDFEFHISRNFDASPADEIFADGMILPFQVTNASSMPKRLYKYELPPIVSTSSSIPPKPLPLPLPQHYSEKGTPGSSANSDSEAEKTSKSFWSFKRSSSLNCDVKNSLICSFPRLTRSNSTGSSVMNSKREMLRDINKHSSQRHGAPRPEADPLSHLSSSCSSPSSVCCSTYQFRPQKQAGKNGGSGGSFGLGSILRVLKDKKTKNK
ncbi:uncharacterized protein LOC106360910 [Brassica napus]|uniref:uncharacterized protein LOC106328199 n=1 Tax=Brassica oleracea var. oleracea TaxID=109376 RepID=UPI0006A70C48|nr:PREDICTED: uncharacterized protein LOC106328199 [Brassica oleracea var. oleracea]XP_013622045.1 PREDICTED: uncharacterized protein LOC106328199 [Brassica oleracea var. oleracea]XP_022555291.1 uncharacterized protein LOC106360910 [Brassica napus]